MSLGAREIARLAFDATLSVARIGASETLPCGVLALAPGTTAAQLRECPCMVTIGAFDGVHAAHASLVKRAVADAASCDGLAVAVTFDPDPADVISGPRPGSDLLVHEDRVRALLSLGLDAVLSVRFDDQLAALSAHEFFDDVLAPVMRVSEVVVGTNFRLGAGNAGTLDVIRGIGAARGFGLVALPLVDDEGQRVSSTRIRGLLAEGDVKAAARLLSRAPIARGTVVRGRGEGRNLGFPTANLLVSDRVCLPAQGVYAGLACASDDAWPAAVNVGAPRSVAALGIAEGDTRMAPSLEATLLGFDGNLYGQPLTIVFLRHLRPPQTFASIDALKAAVLGNIDDVSRELGEGKVSFR